MNLTSRILKDNRYKREISSQDYLQLTLSFLFVTIFLAFAIRPSVATALKLYKKIGEQEKQNRIMTEKIVSLREVKRTYLEITPYLASLNKAEPKTTDEGEYIRNLNFIAAENDVQIKSVNMKFSNEEAQGVLEIDLVLNGSYQDLKSFTQDLNNLLRITTVDSISLKPNSTKWEKGVSLFLKAKAYYEIE